MAIISNTILEQIAEIETIVQGLSGVINSNFDDDHVIVDIVPTGNMPISHVEQAPKEVWVRGIKPIDIYDALENTQNDTDTFTLYRIKDFENFIDINGVPFQSQLKIVTFIKNQTENIVKLKEHYQRIYFKDQFDELIVNQGRDQSELGDDDWLSVDKSLINDESEPVVIEHENILEDLKVIKELVLFGYEGIYSKQEALEKLKSNSLNTTLIELDVPESLGKHPSSELFNKKLVGVNFTYGHKDYELKAGISVGANYILKNVDNQQAYYKNVIIKRDRQYIITQYFTQKINENSDIGGYESRVCNETRTKKRFFVRGKTDITSDVKEIRISLKTDDVVLLPTQLGGFTFFGNFIIPTVVMEQHGEVGDNETVRGTRSNDKLKFFWEKRTFSLNIENSEEEYRKAYDYDNLYVQFINSPTSTVPDFPISLTEDDGWVDGAREESEPLGGFFGGILVMAGNGYLSSWNNVVEDAQHWNVCSNKISPSEKINEEGRTASTVTNSNINVGDSLADSFASGKNQDLVEVLNNPENSGDVDIDSSGMITYSGTFTGTIPCPCKFDGEFNGDAIHGSFLGGNLNSGNFEGIWFEGTFRGTEFRGIFLNGRFESGTFKGVLSSLENRESEKEFPGSTFTGVDTNKQDLDRYKQGL